MLCDPENKTCLTGSNTAHCSPVSPTTSAADQPSWRTKSAKHRLLGPERSGSCAVSVNVVIIANVSSSDINSRVGMVLDDPPCCGGIEDYADASWPTASRE